MAFFFSASKNKQPAKRKDEKSVSRVEIFPGSHSMRLGNESVLIAVGYDYNGEPVDGLRFNWTAIKIEEGVEKRFFNFTNGVFNPRGLGEYKIRAEFGGVNKEILVSVVIDDTHNNPPLITHRVNSKTRQIEIIEENTESDKQSKKVNKEGLLIDPYEIPGYWDDDTWDSSILPGNQPGSPPGAPLDGGAGNGNFQLSAPVVSLPGRGIDIALNLNYNSRVWNKADNKITYDIDHGFPAPGWSLGFGKMAFMGPQGGCMLVDADGTRHGYDGILQNWPTITSFKGRTIDGSFIDYRCHIGYSGSHPNNGGVAFMPNGTKITYGAYSSTTTHLYPTMIADAQGNFISITYKNNQGPAIDKVIDTMGRMIEFIYDNQNRLISVEVPRMNDQDPVYGTGSRRDAIKLHYKNLTLTHSFAGGMTVEVRNNPVRVLDSIYYSGTKTGFWFNDNDSYSTYGMITKVLEQRDMDWQSTMEAQGEIIEGDTTKEVNYNYPLSAANETGRTNGIGLSDAPTYTELSESWALRDVLEDAVTTYAFNDSDSKWDGTTTAAARSVTATQPNGVISKQYTYKSPGTWKDGLVFTDETIIMDGTTPIVVSSSLVNWQEGNYDSPRPTWAEVYDENGHKVRTNYTYGTNLFNQITKSCDYDNSNTLLRCSTATYENDSSYIGLVDGFGFFSSGRHIFNLVLSSRVEDPTGTVISRTDYQYDMGVPQDAPGVIQHLHTHNIHTTYTMPGPICLIWNHPTIGCAFEGQYMEPYLCMCEEFEEVSVFDYATLKRGNITKVTTYTNAHAATGAVEETRSYDITGNLITTTSSCCEQTSSEYTIDTMYAYPESQTRGAANPASPHRVTTEAVYSYATGLVKETKDANGLITTPWYNPDTLRPVKTVSSTGAYTTISYDDAAMTVTEEVYDNADVLAGKTKKYLNGIGLVIKEEAYNPGSIIDIVENKYTKFGEPWKEARPYRTGDTVYWTEREYDAQGRLSKVIEPDGSETKAFYNETTKPSSATNAPGNTIRTVDAWGRERWGRYDQQKRLVEIVEPNPNGDGTVFDTGNMVTKYKYDTLGRLIESEQGSQFRYFKYDDLGRLTRQKLAEQTATLNQAGTFVGIGHGDAVWAEAFIYDNRSNLITRTDARGVKSHFSYDLPGGGLDPLNRIHERTYDLTGPLQPSLPIHAAPKVTYEYMTSGDKTRIKKIRTDGWLTEDYTYDGQARVSEYKQTVDNQESYPMETGYLYDTLDRVTEVHYPAQFGLAGNPRKVVAHAYDTASRLTQLTYGGDVQASGIVFNAAGQTTEIKIGEAGTNQVTEEYTFDPQTGLLTNQKATKNGTTTLLDLTYGYSRLGSVGSLNGKTGHLTKIEDNLDSDRSRVYEFDALGRLIQAKGGKSADLWNQTYTYDRYGNRTNVTATGTAADSSPIPIDGIPNLTYDNTTNRITTTGFQYDAAGNQIRALAENGVDWLLYEYDAANRILLIKVDGTTPTVVEAYYYGSSNSRLITHNNSLLITYASAGGTTLAEYIKPTGPAREWSKSYTYLGGRLLATVTPNGSGGEYVELNHPDRLGTRLQTNQPGGTSYEQVTLPYGTALNAESTVTTNNKRFTSYDRSAITGLDYAVNRTYDNKQGRFTQVDPIGFKASNLEAPQTLNLYAYCGNDPINRTDPDGQFVFAFFGWLVGGLIGAALVSKKVRQAIAVAIRVIVSVLNNQWVQLGFFILDFILPGISKVASGLAKILSAINNAYLAVSNIMDIVQIGAMMIEGQWKQLGISLGMATVLAPLTSIMAGVKKGIQDALFSSSFDELADLFRGAWAGFKNELEHFAEGIKRKGLTALIPFYGNRCGPSYGDTPGTPGINYYDSNACGWHDDRMSEIRGNLNYRESPTGPLNRLGYRKKIIGDLRFLGRSLIFGAGPHVFDIAFRNRPSIGGSFKFMSFPSFGARIVYFGFRMGG